MLGAKHSSNPDFGSILIYKLSLAGQVFGDDGLQCFDGGMVDRDGLQCFDGGMVGRDGLQCFDGGMVGRDGLQCFDGGMVGRVRGVVKVWGHHDHFIGVVRWYTGVYTGVQTSIHGGAFKRCEQASMQPRHMPRVHACHTHHYMHNRTER